jgi:ArsR family transcriptional regulator
MPSEMTRVLRALADPTRLQIVEFLSSMCFGRASVTEDGGVEGPTAGQICCHITGTERVTSTISHHLAELRETGLIQAERRGKYMICTLCPDALREVSSFLLSLAGSEPASCCSHPKENPCLNPN